MVSAHPRGSCVNVLFYWGMRDRRCVGLASEKRQAFWRMLLVERVLAIRGNVMQPKPLIILLCLNFISLVPSPAFALRDANGVLTVGSREFFVGELTTRYEEHVRDFVFDHSVMLKALIDSEPLFDDQIVEFFQSGVPARQLVGELPNVGFRNKETAEPLTDSIYLLDGYDVFRDDKNALYLFPHNSSLVYSVACPINLDNIFFSFCDIQVKYPYDTNVMLKSRWFFPGPLSDVGQSFEPIAQRMIEIAICLDVTDQTDAERAQFETEVLLENPQLAGCNLPALTS